MAPSKQNQTEEKQIQRQIDPLNQPCCHNPYSPHNSACAVNRIRNVLKPNKQIEKQRISKAMNIHYNEWADLDYKRMEMRRKMDEVRLKMGKEMKELQEKCEEAKQKYLDDFDEFDELLE